MRPRSRLPRRWQYEDRPTEGDARSNHGWVDDFSQQQVRGIGALEVFGAAGLILPGLLDLATVLTPIAATGLALTMVGASTTHLRRHEQRMLSINVVLFARAVFVAIERFGRSARA